MTAKISQIISRKPLYLLALLVTILILTAASAATQSKNLGLPQIKTYEKLDYASGPENLGISYQGNKKLFANQAGLLVYDGTHWTTYLTPLNTIQRSVNVANDTIWIGGQSELGYFIPDPSGSLQYTSITDVFFDNNYNLGEIWDLECLNGWLYIRSSTHDIYAYRNGKVIHLINSSHISKIKAVNRELIVSIKDEGISKIDSTHEISMLIDASTFNFNVVDIAATDSTMYFLTESNGIYRYDEKNLTQWETNVDDYLETKLLRCGIYSSQLGLLIGTKLGGFVQIDEDGKALRVLDKSSGLLNNEVNAIAIDTDLTVWLTSQNGIDRFNVDSGQSIFFPDGELQGAVYDVKRWNNKLFFCTNNGLYTIDDQAYYNPLEEINFDLVAGTVGRAWGLDIIDDELYLAHEYGAFKITDEYQAIPIIEGTGAWKYVKLEHNLIAVGTYTGVYLIHNVGNRWQVKSQVPGLNESCRVMMVDLNDNLWISHPYKKVYKITFSRDYTSSSIKEYDNDDGLHTNNRNYVFSIQNECIVTNETGVYKYTEASDNFEKYQALDTIFHSNIHLKRILPTGDNHYWTIASNGTKQYRQDQSGRFVETNVIDSHIDLTNLIGGFENLFAADSASLFLCTIKGVNNVSTGQQITSIDAPNITSISLPTHRDSVIYGGFGQVPHLQLAKDQSAIMFEFNSSQQVTPYPTLYSYTLEGIDQWSIPSPNQSKEYNNLKGDDYTFKVKISRPDGSFTEPTQVTFTIETPWYASLWAKAIYALLFVIILSGLLLIPRQQYQKSTALLETEKKNTEQEMENLKRETERELEAIKREQLETEILFKNKELAMSTMHLLQKNQTLTAIRTEVEKNLSKIKDPNAKKEVKKIISLLRSDDRLEDDWSNFSLHFDQAHHNFLKRMKAKYPQLTPKDQKLCAYLRMNLTTKEIAPLLNISVRGVEIARYRLRKKIELEKERNLNDFMMQF